MGSASPDIQISLFSTVFEGDFAKEDVCVYLGEGIWSFWRFGKGICQGDTPCRRVRVIDLGPGGCGVFVGNEEVCERGA